VERELTVELRPEALQQAGIGIGQVVNALQAQNLAAPVGRINGSLDEKTIRLRGRLDGPEDFLQLVVAERNGQVIRLGQVANVVMGPRSNAPQRSTMAATRSVSTSGSRRGTAPPTLLRDWSRVWTRFRKHSRRASASMSSRTPATAWSVRSPR
jgi:hypothetical protein